MEGKITTTKKSRQRSHIPGTFKYVAIFVPFSGSFLLPKKIHSNLPVISYHILGGKREKGLFWVLWSLMGRELKRVFSICKFSDYHDFVWFFKKLSYIMHLCHWTSGRKNYKMLHWVYTTLWKWVMGNEQFNTMSLEMGFLIRMLKVPWRAKMSNRDRLRKANFEKGM